MKASASEPVGGDPRVKASASEPVGGDPRAKARPRCVPLIVVVMLAVVLAACDLGPLSETVLSDPVPRVTASPLGGDDVAESVDAEAEREAQAADDHIRGPSESATFTAEEPARFEFNVKDRPRDAGELRERPGLRERWEPGDRPGGRRRGPDDQARR